MRNMLKVAGLMIGLTVFGCGGTVDEGPHEFKATDTKSKAFEDMKNQMIGNFKSKAYLKNKPAAPPTGGAAPAEKKD
ncbi:MAG: hypothetical protein ACP5XB_19410 [Isosphaeraceae bacterium]